MEYVGQSLLNNEIMTLISNFGADMTVTVLALIAVLVPIGLSLWGIKFAVNKGLSFLQRKANSTVK